MGPERTRGQAGLPCRGGVSPWRGRRLPLNAAEGVLSALLSLDFKVEGPSGCGAAGKVDERDLVKADVHRGLVHVDEAPLQGVQES